MGKSLTLFQKWCNCKILNSASKSMHFFPQFQRVVHLMSQKSWRIADLFNAVVQFCKLHEKEEEEEGRPLSGLFDWVLEML